MTDSPNPRHLEILKAIHDSPEPDGDTTFSLSLPPIVLYVRVEHDYTVYYNVVEYPTRGTRRINVYHIKETTGTVREMLKSPFSI